MTTHEIMLSHGEKNEATALPFWGIVVNAFSGNRTGEMLLAGIWFSREAAQSHLTLKAHRYPKKAYVYCFSGHESYDLRRMYMNAREEANPAVVEYPDAPFIDQTRRAEEACVSK